LARCNISEYYSDIFNNVYFKMDWYFDFLKLKKERILFGNANKLNGLTHANEK
jgi:hypothetical protein